MINETIWKQICFFWCVWEFNDLLFSHFGVLYITQIVCFLAQWNSPSLVWNFTRKNWQPAGTSYDTRKFGLSGITTDVCSNTCTTLKQDNEEINKSKLKMWIIMNPSFIWVPRSVLSNFAEDLTIMEDKLYFNLE